AKAGETKTGTFTVGDDAPKEDLRDKEAEIAIQVKEISRPTPAAAMDVQLPYLKAVLGFIGIEKVSVILVEPTAAEGPDAAEKVLAAAVAEARRKAAAF
ncbi:MAG: NAD(P)H-dependent oxidoreductase, partial [Phycisphaerae bacterium]